MISRFFRRDYCFEIINFLYFILFLRSTREKFFILVQKRKEKKKEDNIEVHFIDSIKADIQKRTCIRLWNALFYNEKVDLLKMD